MTDAEQQKQIGYRDARFTKQYDSIWQSVGKCVFCDLNEKYVFFEENGIVMTISLYAYIDGHLMIAPRRHIRSTKELTQREWETVRKFTYIAKKLIKKVHGTKGMQVVLKDGITAQSTVSDHLHFHCIPFDTPDLCVWNYRKLENTPLENVALYKQARKDIIKGTSKFNQQYVATTAFELIGDAVIVNTNNQALLQVRKPEYRLNPDYLTIPGGHVDDFAKDFTHEVAREVQEETGLQIDPEDLTLFASRPGAIQQVFTSKPLRAEYPNHKHFIWNTYVVKGIDPAIKLTPGDDCGELLWLSIEDIEAHPKISNEILHLMRSVLS